MKTVCIKTSLSITGKLYFKVFINLALKINCRKIPNEKKISGKKDFKTMLSIKTF